MRRIMLAALGAAAVSFAMPAQGQELALKTGEFWDVGAISVDDGHFPDYVDFLAGEFRKRNDFAASKGWVAASSGSCAVSAQSEVCFT